VVKDNVGRLAGELGVNKSVKCDAFSLQYSNSFGWPTGRASDLQKLGVSLLVVTI